MQLMRSVHKSKDGIRRGYLTHVPDSNGLPLCRLANRDFGNNSFPSNWILELGEQPSCKVCARRAEQLKGGVA